MNRPNHAVRWIAAGVSVLALAGAGTVAATTEPPDTTSAADDTSMSTEDTSMGSAAAMGAGPSDCPAITGGAESTESDGTAADGTGAASTEAAGTDAAATEAAGTDTAGTEAASTEAAGTEAAGTDAMVTETTGGADTSAAPMASVPIQIVETDEFGPILVDGECFTLYGFTKDVDGETTCEGECAANWPPVFVDGEVPPLADELDPALFSVVEHPDGSMLKVGDWPLYYFAGDTAPGDINGQAVGGVWWVVAPDGTLIETEEGGEADGTEAPGSTEAADGTAAADTATGTTEG